MGRILNEAYGIQDELIKHRRYLHMNPEIGFNLPKTTSYIVNELRKMGYDPKVYKGGIVAVLKGKRPGKTVLLRGDMDAFDIKEEANVSYKSRNDYMHVCGHDMHATMVLGAAKVLKLYQDQIDGTVKFVFQAAEETTEGAIALVNQGIMDNPKVDSVLSIHMISALSIGGGKIIIPPGGPNLVGLDGIEINIKPDRKGVSEDTFLLSQLESDVVIDGIVSNSSLLPLILGELQSLNSREDIGISKKFTLWMSESIKEKRDGITVNGILRTYYDRARVRALNEIDDIVKKYDAISDGSVTMEIVESCPPVVADKGIVDFCKRIFRDEFNSEMIVTDSKLFNPSFLASDDVAHMLQRAPGAHIFLTSFAKSNGVVYPIHHPKVILDDSILYKGTAAMARFALSQLKA